MPPTPDPPSLNLSDTLKSMSVPGGERGGGRGGGPGAWGVPRQPRELESRCLKNARQPPRDRVLQWISPTLLASFE